MIRSWSARVRELVPVTPVAVDHNVDLHACWLPGRTLVEDGFTDNRDYVPLRAIDWARVGEVCALEQEVFELIAHTVDDSGTFEARLSDLEYDNVPAWDLESIELGVASCVFALNALGCATAFSCRGHGGSGYPQVRLAVEGATVEPLLQEARSAGCGMSSDSEGLAWIYAPSMLEMCSFADLLVARFAQTVKTRALPIAKSPRRPSHPEAPAAQT
jgi:hypothetical protein